ncbi:MAG: type II secretion system protein [bacterium]|nr:type II secretion system protein [bacterium]
MLKKDKKGFTLIELLVVIAIIGILASVVLASLNRARKQGRDARRVSDIKQLQLALELSFDANQEYPETLAALVTGGEMPSEPKDPSTAVSYVYKNYSGTGASRAACDADATAGTCTYYQLGATLEEVSNIALKSDADLETSVDSGPDGVSATAACAADATATVATDLCYDVTP